ncbi:flavin reductase family protein [Marinimicrobium sp. ABcell2]|uniref:flavin reductase family protein n=1 Tax=Marinimicrobium sp. ABcell2 TaxID=3069751 RepID=UPI0027B6F16D|nr:flavin reductase family protein [Marinimicrobium sp. ABcell2]MDQ2078214.1 flavin reductase family protein [Marinimicrobium sp. ABcell2]
MIVDMINLPKADVYKLMTHTVIPRPVAWVLSENDSGSFNLAPFSYFNAIASDPALVMFSVGHKRDGSKKDTWSNIEKRERFVIHLGVVPQAKQLNETARALPAGESELERIDSQLVEDAEFGLPRLADCPIAFACQRYDIHLLGGGPQAVIYAEIKHAFINDELIDPSTGLPGADKIQPLARLGGEQYASLGEIFSLRRPS